MLKGLFFVLVGFLVGLAVIGKKVLPPQSGDLVSPSNGAAPVTYENSGITDGGT